ncbi:MAG: hypothetical protein V4620_05170 [Bacteroidota bacterium]
MIEQTTIKEELLRIASVYLEDTIDYKKLSQITTDYKALLQSLNANDLNTREGRQHIYMNNGLAIGPFWAALCLDDIMRTRQFIRGTHKAISDKLAQTNNTINILYAGTGPFATILLPLIFKYPKNRINYTFLEINPISLDWLKSLIDAIDFTSYPINLLLRDASTYNIDKKHIPDVIVSETMQNVLDKEQQVPIFLHLMNQAKPDTIFIPEKISIQLGLKQKGINDTELENKHYQRLKMILEISKESMKPFIQKPEEWQYGQAFGADQTIIEMEQQANSNSLLLLTDIQVYSNEIIEIAESGLTLPRNILNLAPSDKRKLTINSRYQISNKPKLEYEIV